MTVEHVDFVSFLTRDIPRAKQFYSEILGLEIESEGDDDMEFRAGQVTLDIFNPPARASRLHPIWVVWLCVCRTWTPRAPSSRQKAWNSTARQW